MWAAKEKQLDVQQKLGRLLDKRDVYDAALAVGARLRQALESRTQLLAGDLASMTDPAEIVAKLQAADDRVLIDLADEFETLAGFRKVDRNAMQLSVEAPLASRVPGLEPALGVMAEGLRKSLRPPKRRRVWEWAAAERRVSEESGSPYPGRWSNDLAPYLIEIMDCLSLSHPARSVAVRKGAQLGVTECGLNLQGQIIDEAPCSILTVLPSISTLNSYVKEKLGPTIDATPSLRSKIKEQKAAMRTAQTTTLKKFPGGVLSLTTASSSKGLQMISRRIVICEEVSEYPYDVDGRGDPVAMAETRTSAWAGREKIFYNSTPAIKGACRITAKEEEGDQRRLYVPCPHCGVSRSCSGPGSRRKAPRRPATPARRAAR